MIIPNKMLNLNLSVVRISSLILKEILKKKIISHDDLLNFLMKKEGDNVRFVFLNSLSFLYILGKIEYHLKTDSIEVVE